MRAANMRTSMRSDGRLQKGLIGYMLGNEQAAAGDWPAWGGRWQCLIQAIGIIGARWSGGPVTHRGKHYAVDAKLYGPPPQPIPLLIAANSRKSMPLAGRHGDGLMTDPD